MDLQFVIIVFDGPPFAFVDSGLNIDSDFHTDSDSGLDIDSDFDTGYFLLVAIDLVGSLDFVYNSLQLQFHFID